MTLLPNKPVKTYFSDILWATSRGNIKIERKQKDVIKLIIHSPSVHKALFSYITLKKFEDFSEEQSMIMAEKEAQAFAEELCSKMKKSVLRSSAWATHKILKRVYDKIIVDIKDLKMIKRLQEKSSKPIILMPTRKSYVDMLLIGYVFFANGMNQPFFCTPVQYLDIRLINRIFRSCGSLFVRETENNELYKAVLKEYLSILASDKQTISVSIEETREKSGMLVKANSNILESVLDSYFSGKTADMDIIPMTINYDRVLEGETFPYELVGEEKVQESLTRFISSARYIGTPFGKVCINIGEKISIKKYAEMMGIKQHQLMNVTDEQKRNVCESLCQTVLESNSRYSVIMSTAPLASVLLEYRKGISQENMVKQMEYIYQELKARNAPLAEKSSVNSDISASMTLLTEFVKKKRDVFEPFVSPKVDYKNILMLAYYKNSLVHIFLKEMIVGVSFLGFGRDTIKQTGITKERVWEKVEFLSKMLNKVFVQESIKIKSYDDFEDTLYFM